MLWRHSRATHVAARALLGLFLLGTILACTPAAAPTSEPQPGPTQAPAETAAAPTAVPTVEPKVSGEIDFLIWQNSPAMDEIVLNKLPRLFEQTHPGTKINTTVLPYDQYGQKLALLMSAGTPPDLWQPAADYKRYVAEGKVLITDEYINNNPIISDPAQSRVDSYAFLKQDGQHYYGIPMWGTLCGMQIYYNKDLFDKAGVAYPDDTWTWDDFRAAAAKLTIRNGEETEQWGCDWGYLPGWDGGWAPLVWGYGGEVYDDFIDTKEVYFDSPEVVAAWQYMQDLIYKDKVAPPPSVSGALAQSGGSPFASGKVAMVVDGCWMMDPYMKAVPSLGMTVIPKGPKGRVNVVWGTGLAISKDSDNPDLAAEYVLWADTDEEANKLLASAGQTCGAPVVRKYDQYYANSWASVPGGDACAQSLDNVRFCCVNNKNWSEAWDNVIGPEWDKFVNGKITAQEFADAVAGPANEILAK